MSEGRRREYIEKEKEKEQCVKRVDFTLVSTVRNCGLDCDGKGEETGFELTLWWTFEMKRFEF